MTLEEVRAQCEVCSKCELGKTKTKTVFGTGNEKAKLMFIGEAPGKNEDEQGVPFVGEAGQLFDKYLDAVGIKREEVYIANMLKCRPPRNRDPQEEEMNVCMDYLREQIRSVNPAIIVCLGRISACRLIDPQLRITRDHGKWVKKGRFEMCAVYHPSLLLRDPSRREEMLADMLEVKKRYDKVK